MFKKLFLAVALILGATSAHAACIVPNPNLLGPPFTDGCPLPAVGLNLLSPLANPHFTGGNDSLTFTTTYTATGFGSTEAGAVKILNTDTGANTAGLAKVSALTVDDTFGGGSTGEGNRNAIFAHLNQTGALPYTNGAFHFHTAVFGWMDIGAGDAAPGGLYYGFGGLAETTPGHSIAMQSIKGAEFDTSIKAGSTSPYHATLTVDIVNSHAVRGSGFDAAIVIGADNSVTTTYKNGFVLGDPNGKWPFGTDSTLIGTAGTSQQALYGVDLSGVTMIGGGCSFKSMILCVNDSGGALALTSSFVSLSLKDSGITSPNVNGGLVRLASSHAATDAYSWQINTASAGDFSSVNTGIQLFATGSVNFPNNVTVAGTFGSNLITPASSSAACLTGQLAWDTGFVYVCTATNTWKRVAVATF